MAVSNLYDIQYWIYAWLNNNYHDCTITRDSCHRRYYVNRHSFIVSDVDNYDILKADFEKFLISSGYRSTDVNRYNKIFTLSDTYIKSVSIVCSVQRNGVWISVYGSRF